MINYFEKIKIDKSSINTGMSPCPTSYLVQKHGMPRKTLGTDCQPVTNQFWRSRMVTKDVGPFKLTGLDIFLDVLTLALQEVNKEYPGLYILLRSSGCLCCRKVRGSVNTLSNHGLGTAVDFEIFNPVSMKNELDSRGDGYCQKGMLMVYSVLKKYGIYWGAEFPTEDSMHFEASKELVLKWVKEGKL